MEDWGERGHYLQQQEPDFLNIMADDISHFNCWQQTFPVSCPKLQNHPKLFFPSYPTSVCVCVCVCTHVCLCLCEQHCLKSYSISIRICYGPGVFGENFHRNTLNYFDMEMWIVSRKEKWERGRRKHLLMFYARNFHM